MLLLVVIIAVALEPSLTYVSIDYGRLLHLSPLLPVVAWNLVGLRRAKDG